MSDTIFALSSGAPPAGIAVVRMSGEQAKDALIALAGRLPEPRRASLALLRDPQDGEALDRALILWMPGPSTVTGEDMVEFHCHGSGAVVAALDEALGRFAGVRKAEAGEFTRRAFENGRMDLNAVEGLSDLLAAETQTQRRAALDMAEGHFSQRIARWREDILTLSALAEAALDFSDEDDVPDDGIGERIKEGLTALSETVNWTVSAPSAERLKDGIRVVLAGPPNAGKSTLLNALVGRDAAIVSDVAGTTRDRIEVPVAINGVAFLFTDTAGLRQQAGDAVEMIGIDRAHAAIEAADIILWLGEPDELPRHDAILIAAQADRLPEDRPGLRVSALMGEGMSDLVASLLDRASAMLPGRGEFALNARQKGGAERIVRHLEAARRADDLLVVAEELRVSRQAIDMLTGQAGIEDMLDRLFSGFCIGK